MSEPQTIKNIPIDDRPREKMILRGASALTDAELLAILIGSGTKNRSAIMVAADILKESENNLRELGKFSVNELKKIKGIGEARAITICAAMELGRRRQLSDGLDTPFIRRSKDAANIFMPLLQDQTHECTCVIYLNTASKVIKFELMNNGGLTSSIVDVRIILKNALLFSASQIVLGHNHPSGNKQASAQDKALTIKLRDAALLLDIKLLDHIIIAGGDFLSLSDEGYM